MKTLTIKTPSAINPFFYYSVFWGITIIFYIASPSVYNARIEPGLMLFLGSTIVVSALLAFHFNKKYKDYTFTYACDSPRVCVTLLLILLYILDFAYSGGIPLLTYLLKSSGVTYDEVGIPTVHVIIVTYSIYYAIINAFQFYVFRKKINLFSVSLVFLYALLSYSRAIILFVMICIVATVLAFQQIKGKHILVFILGVFVVSLSFGIMGNIRVGAAWNDTSRFLQISGINKDGIGFLTPLYWVEEYIVCSFRNLNYNISNCLPTHNVSDFLYYYFPDFISKRIFPEPITQAQRAIYAFTTSTMYANIFCTFGYLGMIIEFITYVLVAEAVVFLRFKSINNKIVALAILSALFALSMFQNMLSYSGFSFSLVYAVLFGMIGIEGKRFIRKKSC